MQTAKQGDTVLVSYTVRTNDGRVVGGTEADAPQELTIGGAQIFPEIEAALDGMSVGSEQTVTVSSENAFGPRREDMVIQIPRNQLPEGEAPQAGMTLAAQQQDGSTVNLVITAVSEDTVTADANHPLAGEDLQFGLKLVDIQTAA
jgi:FKBP-type peptidyl-prolyl cis-trans isomerase 2